MHGRLTKAEENGAVDSMEMPVPTTSGGRTRRTGLLTVMERPPGIQCHYILISSINSLPSGRRHQCMQLQQPKKRNTQTIAEYCTTHCH